MESAPRLRSAFSHTITLLLDTGDLHVSSRTSLPLVEGRSGVGDRRPEVGSLGGVDRATLIRRIAAGGAACPCPPYSGPGCVRRVPGGRPRRGVSRATEVEVRVRQPRHDEPVLHPDPVRRGGRVRARQLRVTSGPARRRRRRRDGERLQRRDQREGRRASRSRSSTRTLRGADQAGARGGHPGRLLQRRRRANRAARRGWPTSARTSTSPASQMGQRIATLVPKGDVALFIATPGALNIQPRIDGALAAIKESGKPINATAVATDADLTEGTDRRSTPTTWATRTQGHVRGRRRLTPRASAR